MRLIAALMIVAALIAPCAAQMPSIPLSTYNNPVADFQRDVNVLQAEQRLLRSQMQVNAPPAVPDAQYVANLNEQKRQFWQYCAGATAQQGGAPHAVATYAANHYGLLTGQITPQEYEAERARLMPEGQPGIMAALRQAQTALDPAAQARIAQFRAAGPSELAQWKQFLPTAWAELNLLAKKVDEARGTLAKNPKVAQTVFDDSIVWRTQLQDKVSGPYNSLVQSTGYRSLTLQTAINDLNVNLNALQAAARK